VKLDARPVKHNVLNHKTSLSETTQAIFTVVLRLTHRAFATFRCKVLHAYEGENPPDGALIRKVLSRHALLLATATQHRRHMAGFGANNKAIHQLSSAGLRSCLSNALRTCTQINQFVTELR